MKNFKNNKKILFIPGWLDTGRRHGYKNSLDIWDNDINIKQDFEADYIIAHSISSLVALYNWKLHRNFKIILVNPVISRKGIFSRWYQYSQLEGVPNSLRKSINTLQIIPSLIKAMRLFKIPAFDIISSIPKEDLTIIYGENDFYLFDRKAIGKLKEKDFRVQEVKGAGHNYEENIDRAVFDAISGSI